MLHPLERRLVRKKAPGEGTLGGPTVVMQTPRHPAPDQASRRGLEAGLEEEEDPIVLPAPCPAVQAQTRIPLDLGPDLSLHPRKG